MRLLLRCAKFLDEPIFGLSLSAFTGVHPPMCGIAGLYSLNNTPFDSELLGRMIDQVEHRGPDGRGTFLEHPVGLSHSRLGIIDIAGGHQPMSNSDKTLWITFNGEIFNYIELREMLIQKGHTFTTHGDTEVILNLYREMGENCVKELNGQFAFCIWDSRKRSVFLARDRLGIRPLFWTIHKGLFHFASEVKSLFANPDLPRELDPKALDQTFHFWSPIAPRSIFAGVHDLPPGHTMTIQGESITQNCYWRLDYTPESHHLRSEADWAEELQGLLLDSTRLMLRSDVPVGAYLSGGLDSTVTTALVRKLHTNSLRTFSVTFEDQAFDERSWQQEVVAHLSTDHSEILCTGADIARVFPKVIWHAEKPIVRTAPAPMFLLSGLVRRSGFKVVLTGEGSDEILGGYDIFKEAKVRRFMAEAPQSALRPLLLRRLYPWQQDLQRQSPSYLRAFFNARPEDLESPFFSHLPRWGIGSKNRLFYGEKLRASLQGFDPLADLCEQLPAAWDRWDPFSRSQYLEAAHLMPNYILSSQGDRMGMGHSVEGRFPFLDHRVAEFASRLPPRFKMKGLVEKHLLKQSMRELIPPSVANRPKQPYRAPDAVSFFENGKARDWVRSVLSPENIRDAGYFHDGAVGKLVEKGEAGGITSTKDNMAFVGILSTQLLWELYIRRNGSRKAFDGLFPSV